MGRRLQRTHPGLSADLQAVLQGQLVVLGGDDRPVEGDRDTLTSTTTGTGGVNEGGNLPAHGWNVSPEAASSVGGTDGDGIHQNGVTLLHIFTKVDYTTCTMLVVFNWWGLRTHISFIIKF